MLVAVYANHPGRPGAGPHNVLIELVNANHQVIDKASLTFDVPKRSSAVGGGEGDTKVR